MNTLFAKLSLTLLIIVGLMGAALFAVDRFNTRVYYEELSQTLNAPIAMYVTGQRQLISGGVPDLDSLRELANHAMIINPTAEIYLLDTEGKILGHGLPAETVLRNSVDLAPIRALIESSAHMPIRGDDPRSTSSRKIFSASEVISADGVEGYLYVILGGQAYEALADDIGDSYTGRASAAMILAIIVLTAIIGLLVFGLLTRRLKALSHAVRQASESGFELDPAFERRNSGGDEIDALTDAFVDMSSRIREQIEQLQETDHALHSSSSHPL